MRLGVALSIVLLAQPSGPATSDWKAIRTRAVSIISELAATRSDLRDPSSARETIRKLLDSKLDSLFQLGVESALGSDDEDLRAAAVSAAFARTQGFYIRAEHVVPQYLVIELFDPQTGTLTYRGQGNRRFDGRLTGTTLELASVRTSVGACPATLELDAAGVLRGPIRCTGSRDFPALIELF